MSYSAVCTKYKNGGLPLRSNYRFVAPIAVLLVVLIFTTCSNRKTPPVAKAPSSKENNTPTTSGAKRKADSYSLDFKIGQMILVGINDRKSLSATDSLRKDIVEGKLGGILLFEKNIASDSSFYKLKKLIADIQALSAVPLFISIDEEGGKVHRLKEKYGFLKMPSAEYLGKQPTTDSTYYYTAKLAATLSALGINLNFAPDVDVAINPQNPVIAKVGRSYSPYAHEVATHAEAAIRAHHAYGVKTVLKHFPGHGSSTTDSHFGITDVTKLWTIDELAPYTTLIGKGLVDAVMTAHIVQCKLDTTCLPATLSTPIVSGLLRKSLKFDGVVFSDDMQMYAISKNYGFENAIKQSILAGVDVLVFGNNVNAADRVSAAQLHATIKKMVLQKEISEERINQSFDRIMALKIKAF